jgi:hypothetical protein
VLSVDGRDADGVREAPEWIAVWLCALSNSTLDLLVVGERLEAQDESSIQSRRFRWDC